MGISQPSVGRLISGETRETGKLLELARALRTTPDYLVGYTDDPDTLSPAGTPLSLEEREMLACLSSIDASDRAAIIQVVRAMARKPANYVANSLTAAQPSADT